MTFSRRSRVPVRWPAGAGSAENPGMHNAHGSIFDIVWLTLVTVWSVALLCASVLRAGDGPTADPEYPLGGAADEARDDARGARWH